MMDFDKAVKEADRLLRERMLIDAEPHAHAHEIVASRLMQRPCDFAGHRAIIERDLETAEQNLARMTWSGRHTKAAEWDNYVSAQAHFSLIALDKVEEEMNFPRTRQRSWIDEVLDRL